MLLPRSDFPAGEFHLSPIETLRGLDPAADNCDPSGWVRAGDQETAANVTVGALSGTIRYTVELFAVQADPNLPTWKKTCLPYRGDREIMHGVDLPGTPEWAVAIESARPGSDSTMHAIWGYYRGVLVSAWVSGQGTDVTSDVRALVPMLFEKQIARLETLA